MTNMLRVCLLALAFTLPITASAETPEEWIFSHGGHLRRQDFEGRQARRFAHPAANSIRVGPQPENRESYRARNPSEPPRTCQSRDRVEALFAAPHVCFWHKADIAVVVIDVRFWG
jgi:hypothetical protein